MEDMRGKPKGDVMPQGETLHPPQQEQGKQANTAQAHTSIWEKSGKTMKWQA